MANIECPSCDQIMRNPTVRVEVAGLLGCNEAMQVTILITAIRLKIGITNALRYDRTYSI